MGGTAQYSVMAERSSRRRGVKRTTRHKHRVRELMNATEGNNLKFSKKSLQVGKKIKKAKVLPPSVLRPFRSWMATARRRVRDHTISRLAFSQSSDTGTDRSTVRTASGFVVSVSTPQGTLSCPTSATRQPTSCGESAYTTIRTREHSMLPTAVPPGLEI